MNRYFSSRCVLVIGLMVGFHSMMQIDSYASDLDETIPSVKTKWALNISGGYISLAIQNNGSQSIRLSPHSSYSTTTNYADTNNVAPGFKYPPSPISHDDSVIYPAIFIVVKSPSDKTQTQFYNISDRGGAVLTPIVVGPGEEKTIKYPWARAFADFAKISDSFVFCLFYNRHIISTGKAEHGKGDLLNMEATAGKP